MIEIKNLSKSYEAPGGTVQVLEGLDLVVDTGAAVAVVGPSGSGKTTLLNLLGCLDRPNSGSIRIANREIIGLPPLEVGRYRNRSLGFVFQQHYLLPQLSVLENVLVPRLAGGWEETPAETEDRARMLLDKTGLSHRLGHMPWQLSGGEKLRCAVARALVNQPSLVLADEPTGLLDQSAAERVADMLIELNHDQGVTMIVVTHNIPLAHRIGRTYELAHGRLREVGT